MRIGSISLLGFTMAAGLLVEAPEALAAGTMVFHASNCQRSGEDSGTPYYTNGEVGNSSGNTVTLYCPLDYDTSAPPTAKQVQIDGWNNTCNVQWTKSVELSVCVKGAGGYVLNCTPTPVGPAPGPWGCHPAGVYHLITGIPTFSVGDSLFVKVKLEKHNDGGDNTMYGYKIL